MLNCNYYMVSEINSYPLFLKLLEKRYNSLQFFYEKESLIKSIEFLSQSQSYLDNSMFIIFTEDKFDHDIGKYLSENLDDLNYLLISFGEKPYQNTEGCLNLYDYIETNEIHSKEAFIFNRIEAEINRKSRMTGLKLQIREFYEIGKLLSSERDIFKLFDMIANTSLNITQADAVTLYLVVDKATGEWSSIENNDCSNKVMKFVISKNISVNTNYQSFTIPITKKSITGYTAMYSKALRIDDAYDISPEMEYNHDSSFDRLTGYKTISMLSVPMKDRNNNIAGVIQLINKKKDSSFINYKDNDWVHKVIPFNYFDELTMVSIAGQAAVALENNLLYKNINQLLQDYVEQNEKLSLLSGKILQAHEEERKRIAREIHDGPAQSAACLAIKLELCKKQLQNNSYQALSVELDRLGEEVRNTVKEIRGIIYNLKPSYLDDGLLSALQKHIENFEESSGIKAVLRASGTDEGLKYYLVSTIFRIVQEALTNISKHSKADRVDIMIDISKTSLLLDICDNGNGFDTTILKQSKHKELSSGFGVEGMKERVELINGTIDINSTIGKGTKIKIKVPIN